MQKHPKLQESLSPSNTVRHNSILMVHFCNEILGFFYEMLSGIWNHIFLKGYITLNYLNCFINVKLI